MRPLVIGYGSKYVESKAFWAELQRQLDAAKLDARPIREAVALLKELVKTRVGDGMLYTTIDRVKAMQGDLASRSGVREQSWRSSCSRR